MTTPSGPPPLPEPAPEQPRLAPSGEAGYGNAPYGQGGYGQTTSGPATFGQAPYGQAPSGQAPSGYPGSQYPPYPPYPGGRKPGTDGFAIAAFVLSLLGGVLLGVIFAVLALRRIKRTGQGGRGLALAALILCAVWVVAIAVLLAVSARSTPSRDTTGALQTPSSVSVNDLKVGDCLVAIPDQSDNVTDVNATPCTKAHRAEVFAAFNLADGDYPGEERAHKLAEDGCTQRVPKLRTKATGPLHLYYVYPQSDSWKLGEHSVTCFVATSTPVTTKIVP